VVLHSQKHYDTIYLSVHNGGYGVQPDTVPWKWHLEEELAKSHTRVPRHQFSHQVGAAKSGSGPPMVLKRQFFVSAFDKPQNACCAYSGRL
jgi:hypothetical protein